MIVSILVRKDLVEEDWDVSDGDSFRAEYMVSKIRATPLSRKKALIEFVGEEDKTIVSIVVDFTELKTIFTRGADAIMKSCRG